MPVAFVLSPDASASSTETTLPGFPGVWTPGEPIEADEFVKLGVFSSVDEMRDRVEELGLPLEEVDVAEGAHPLPERPNHLPSASEHVADVVEEKAGGRITTHAEADRVAAELGFMFETDPRPKVEEKVAAIEAIRTGQPQELATRVDADETGGAE